MRTRLLLVVVITLMAVSAAAQYEPPVTEFEIGQPITAISTYGDFTVVLDAEGIVHWLTGSEMTPYTFPASGSRSITLRDGLLVATAGQTLGIYELSQSAEVSTANIDALQVEYLSIGDLVVLAPNHSVSIYDEDGNATPVNFSVVAEHMAVARGTGLIAVSGVNGNAETLIEIASADDGSLLQTILLSSENISGSLTSIAFPSGGKVIAVGDDTGEIVVFDVETGIRDLISSGSDAAIEHIAFSNNGVLLAAVAGSEVMLWDWQNQVIWTSTLEDETVTALEFSGSDQGFWTGSSDGVLRFWSTGLGTTLDVGGFAVVYTLGGETVFVRAGPGTDYDVVREIPGGGYLLLVDGPVEADGYTWWNVERRARDYYSGWMVEAIPTVQILRPPVNIAGPYFSIGVGSSTQASTYLTIDMIASVNTLNGETLNMRAGAGTSYDVVMELENTWLVHIVDGPVEADGFIWWEVELQGGERGWVVERIEELQTLLPAGE
jgi:WD40 repeat protein